MHSRRKPGAKALRCFINVQNIFRMQDLAHDGSLSLSERRGPLRPWVSDLPHRDGGVHRLVSSNYIAAIVSTTVGKNAQLQLTLRGTLRSSLREETPPN